MEPGKIVAMVWAYDNESNKHLPNHITISNDNGYTWSDPINTGHMGQASNIMWLKDDLILTIHAHRSGDVGLYVRLIDLKNDKWTMLQEHVIWGNVKSQETSKNLIDQYANLKFGQPSLLTLNNGQILATHWCVEDCLYKIKSHRLKLKL